MEFACSHIVCNNSSILKTHSPERGRRVCDDKQEDIFGIINHTYDNQFLKLPKESNKDLYSQLNKLPKKNTTPSDPSGESTVPISYLQRGDSTPPVPPRLDSKRAARLSVDKRDKNYFEPPLPPPLPERTYRNAIPRPDLSANVNVVSLHLGKLVNLINAPNKGSGPTVLCEGCSAAMSAISQVKQDHTGLVWSCEFCQKLNSIRLFCQPYRLYNDVAFVSAPFTNYANVEEPLIVFCVDISGSMSVTSEVKVMNRSLPSVHVSRMQGVQDAIIWSLDSLMLTSPTRRVALVTFNDVVTLYGDGLGAPQILMGYELMDADYLREQGVNYPTPKCITESFHSLSTRVKGMQEHGSTALGPAALISITLASIQTGSQVIICTDGLANTGLGYLDSMDDEVCQSAKVFYGDLAETASRKGVIVSILTFEGTDCRLMEVGKLADRTGGRVNIVKPGNLSSEIQAILEDNVMATNVKISFFIPQDMYFRHEEHNENKLVKDIGNVAKDTEITFEFGIKDQTIHERETVPFQLQVEFKTRDHRNACRIITQEKKITTNSSLVEDSLNITVLGVHAAQISARLTMEGRVQEAQQGLLAQKGFIQKIVEKKQSKEEEDIYENWISAVAAICDDLVELPEGEVYKDVASSQKNKNSILKVFSDEVVNVALRLKNAKSQMLHKSKSGRTFTN
ncbi:circularly permutated Ras protein 1-like isoform X2 [Rhinatrema bivittatum]|uniref:circularly permutated Ras protein 1-like isoform X2 n=1 Tax=Rhinatrema bivittatum TaxID=194408 RepID=UPI00112B2808|nr:circularly permutated Ras protein 1-like isoform X2 [Rhinatrema bivittatum]